MLRVYPASKLHHAAMWAGLCSNSVDYIFHARWLKHVNILKTADNPEEARSFWIQDLEDVKSADAVLVYGTAEEDLRGALIEAGCALALGIPVIATGGSKSFGTWQYHPGVKRTPNLELALHELRVMNYARREMQ